MEKNSIMHYDCIVKYINGWVLSKVIKKCNDGTYIIQRRGATRLLPYDFGITEEEISFNERELWVDIFNYIQNKNGALSYSEYCESLKLLQFKIPENEMKAIWNKVLTQMFCIEEFFANNYELNQSDAYKFFLAIGFSATEFHQKLTEPEKIDYLKHYQNNIRMGGRDPKFISREVTLNDTFKSLGIFNAGIDSQVFENINFIEKEYQIRLPQELKEFFLKDGVVEAVDSCHPNDPHLIHGSELKIDYVMESMNGEKVEKSYGIKVMIPHQGEIIWVAFFNDRDEDAKIYGLWQNEDYDHAEIGEKNLEKRNWQIIAPTLRFFFWDLAQTGLSWFLFQKSTKSKSISENDIGYFIG